MISAGLVYYAQEKSIKPVPFNQNYLNKTLTKYSSVNRTFSNDDLLEYAEDLQTVHWSDFADPVMSILITIIILKSTWSLFIESAGIVLQISPDGIDPEEVKEEIINVITKKYESILGDNIVLESGFGVS